MAVMEKEHFYVVGGNVNHYATSYGDFSRTKDRNSV